MIFLLYLPQIAPAQINLSDIKLKKIWSNEYHNAFTSLLFFKGSFYCSFRQGSDHAGGKDGIIRIIRSKNGLKWETVCILEKEGTDLRDPKLSVTPEGNIMVIMGGSVYKNRELQSMASHVSFSDPGGMKFSPPRPINIAGNIHSDKNWLWRVTWHRETGYGVVYSLPYNLLLVKTKDGVNYEIIKEFDELSGNPNETTIRVMNDGEMIMMIRRQGGNGYWAKSRPPYTEWTFTDAGIRFGGPDFDILNENLFIAGTRVYETPPYYTGLFLVNREGQFREILKLPSGGDNSYPGFVIRKRKLYISYYSSHEGKASVYFAVIPLRLIND